MNKILLKNGTAILPDSVKVCDMLIENGKITKIAQNIEDKEAESFDLTGKHVFAGFFDMHCHLREPGFEHKEDIESGTKAAVHGGFTSVCCMPNTNPVTDNKIVVSYIKQRAKECNMAKVYPIAAVTKGQLGEELAPYASLKAAGAVALSDDGKPVERANMMRLALEYAKPYNLPIISHCEDMSMAEGGMANEGENATRAGLKGISRAAEEIMVARDIILADTLKTSVHIAHISTEGSARLIREAKSRGVKVTCETCPHYYSIDDSAVLGFDGNTKVNPPLRTQKDIAAIKQAVADGTIDAIATDHAPHHSEEKNCEFQKAANGISGFETAFALSYTNLVKTGIITLNKLSKLMSKNPAKIMNIETGELCEGYPAAITVVDLAAKIVIDSKNFLSKGKNTPFNGREVFGKIELVMVDGNVKLSDLKR